MSERDPWRLDGTYSAVVSGPGREGCPGSVEVEVVGLREGTDLTLRADAMPAMPPGLFSMPREGDAVWVEFLDGDMAAPVWRAHAPMVSERLPRDVDGEALRDTHVLLHTPGGERVELDDARGRVRLADRHGNRVRLDEDGTALADRFGNQVVLGEGGLRFTDRRGASMGFQELYAMLHEHFHNTPNGPTTGTFPDPTAAADAYAPPDED